MSNLTIKNLDDGRDLDSAERAEVSGGLLLPGLGEVDLAGYMGITNVVANVATQSVGVNPTNIVMGGGTGDTVNYLGNATITTVNTGAVTAIQAPIE